jgi:chromosome partitioning protein
MGIIIAIVNQKGGVGKSTTAINLAASLTAINKKCLIVDCDPQGNATTGLGVDRSQLHRGLYEFILSSDMEESVLSGTSMSGLALLGATNDLVGAEVEMYSAENREFLLKNKLVTLTDKFDYIFLDCPPSLGFLTINALTAADSVLVPLQCEYYALEGLSQLLRTLKAVKHGLNPNLKIIGILLTMYDSRNNLSSQVAAEVRDHFKATVFKTIIPRNVRLSEAPSYGKPIILYDAKSSGAQSYLSLAKELVNRGARL